MRNRNQGNLDDVALRWMLIAFAATSIIGHHDQERERLAALAAAGVWIVARGLRQAAVK